MFSRICRFFLVIFLIVFSFVLFFEIRFVNFSEIVEASEVAPESPREITFGLRSATQTSWPRPLKINPIDSFTSIFTVKDGPEMLNFQEAR